MGDAPLLLRHRWSCGSGWRSIMCTLGDVMRFAMPAALKTRRADRGGVPARRIPSGHGLRYVKLGPGGGCTVRCIAALEAIASCQGTAGRAARLLCSVSRRRRRRRELPRSALSAPSVVLNKLRKRVSFFFRPEAAPWAPRCLFDRAQVPLAPFLRLRRMIEEVRRGFVSQDCVLLYGVTGSGKTELYMHLMADALARGESVLLYDARNRHDLPTVARVRSVFGSRVTLYHPGSANAAVWRFTEAAGLRGRGARAGSPFGSFPASAVVRAGYRGRGARPEL